MSLISHFVVSTLSFCSPATTEGKRRNRAVLGNVASVRLDALRPLWGDSKLCVSPKGRLHHLVGRDEGGLVMAVTRGKVAVLLRQLLGF